MGRVESAITPMSVMTILITPAKIGRSMKKCGKFIVAPAARERRSFCRLRLSDARLLARSTRRSFLGYRFDLHPGLDDLQARRDDFLAVFKPTLYDAFAFENRTGLKRPPLNCVIGFHHKCVLHAL